MSELLILGLKLLFLALLWLFILFAANVIRTDLFGRKVAASAIAEAPAGPSPRKTRPRDRRADQRPPTALRVTAGSQTGLVLPLGDNFLIGRTEDCALVLDDQYMSTRHALITRTPRGYTVQDLGSTNGTFVNENRISAPNPLTPADTLRIGRTTMRLDV